MLTMKKRGLSWGDRILIALAETGRTFENPYQVVWERFNLSESRGRQAARMALRRLEQAGYLERIERGDKVLYRLTDGGRRRVNRYVFSKKKWDGKWRMVVFDIPEKRRRARVVLRERLLELGFRQFQESVWIGPFDVLEEVRDLRDEYRIQDYVKLLTVGAIEDHERLMKRFGLPAKTPQKKTF